jgi:tRNA nucleotidyltransferase (CCA-adding enzyme)
MILDPPDHPALASVVAACEPAGVTSAWLVGGAVRDRLKWGTWGESPDLDVVFEGDAVAVAKHLGGETVTHAPFGTATWRLGDTHVDLVTARHERYPTPGALPVVSFADLAADLLRRDFTVNALALRLWPDPGEVVDPLGGVEDLRAGILRAHHAASFADDPTRLLRAARYSTRLGLSPEPETAKWFQAADVATVSGERWLAEWRRLLAEPDPAAVLRWLGDHGIAPTLGLDPAGPVVAFDLPEGWLGSLAVVATGPDALRMPAGLRPRFEALRAPAPDLGEDDLSLEATVGPLDPLRFAVLCARSPALAARLKRGRALADEPPLLRGTDLIAAGLRPGPAIGDALRRVRRARRLEGIDTPTAALALLRSEGGLPEA